MSSKIFMFMEKCFKVYPVKTAIVTIPLLVLTTGTIQQKYGILPKNSVYNYSKDIIKTEEFGIYNSPK